MSKVNRGLVAVVVGLVAAGCGGGGGGTPDPVVPPPATTYAISGAVSGAVAAGVSIALGGAQSATATSGSGGAFSFTGLANGSYTVTPTHIGHVFTPTSAPVVVAGGNQLAVNFVAATPAGTWMTKASMPTARSGLASAVVGGNVYALGGSNFAINTAIASIAAPAGRLTPSDSSRRPREQHDPGACLHHGVAGRIGDGGTVARAGLEAGVVAPADAAVETEPQDR